MSCISLLRRIGILPKVTESDFSSAAAENALRDNDEAFSKLRSTLKVVPKETSRLLDTIKKTSSPFADLERMMKQQERIARRWNERKNRK